MFPVGAERFDMRKRLRLNMVIYAARSERSYQEDVGMADTAGTSWGKAAGRHCAY